MDIVTLKDGKLGVQEAGTVALLRAFSLEHWPAQKDFSYHCFSSLPACLQCIGTTQIIMRFSGIGALAPAGGLG